MKRTVSRYILILLIALLVSSFMCGTACAATIPEHTSNFYVNDFAGVFTDEQIKVMMDKAVKLCKEYDGIQVVITTVQSLDGETVENYANQMYNKYKIGKDSMGVLVLMSVNDRKIRVEVGRTMQVYLPDSKAAKLMNTYAIPKLKQNIFAEGLMDLQDALITQIKATLSVEAVESEEENSNVWVWYCLGFIGAVLVILIGVGIYTEYQEEKEKQERLKRFLQHRKMIDSNYSTSRKYSGDYPISRRYSGSYPTSKKYSSGSYTSYNSSYYDTSSSSSNDSSNNDSTIFSDDSSSFSGFDGCSDGGGASSDF